jgi:hypothetical protein
MSAFHAAAETAIDIWETTKMVVGNGGTMALPETTNPAFLRWIADQSEPIRNDIAARWDVTATDERLFPGHRNENYARLTFLIDYCRENYGYV